MALYTVFGGRGFIGSEIVSQLTNLGHTVFAPARGDNSVFTRDLGIVIYCAGNGDCQNTPFAVLEANISLLASVLQQSKFSRLMYISSTRVYMNQTQANEQADLTICVDDNRRLFNLTKLVGEELCLKSSRDVCILRPSNVYGVALSSPLFLPAITRNAIAHGKVDMYISKNYKKDYVSVSDVAQSCITLSVNTGVSQQVINIASGENVSALEIANILEENTGCEITWHSINFPNEIFPTTDIAKICKFIPNYKAKSVLSDLKNMIEQFSNEMNCK